MEKWAGTLQEAMYTSILWYFSLLVAWYLFVIIGPTSGFLISYIELTAVKKQKQKRREKNMKGRDPGAHYLVWYVVF